ncbi:MULTISPECIES: DUF4442 domain-containing protein [Gordonia]|uniref:DUF4442 domain-containing protein n=2 Tax=Gordonia amicalis TaxID=89053 RepID=A0AAE4RAC9_9ACTN|nr:MULTISPECIES: DUF4442 domain-containing protein [Gordonia]MCZ4652587.1 DUF4442 domain-containing protein [Gordonia amicalis]MDJ0454655.1 DUF4442 domain-containing protein [Gordonia amicalis]MDV6313691.1 DUF4442 domain-containing protein [Gordonia amicalis]MDV7077996.1 DUF4442 domain-containing protein [Gordonia amicalis]
MGFSRMRMTAKKMRLGMSLWPPYLGAGVRVTHIADDWSSATVTYRISKLNRNYFGTAFGGTLSSMTDPFYALLLMHQLGKGYVVWDAAGVIDYVSPGQGRLTATMVVDPAVVEQIRVETASGHKSLTWFETEIVDESGSVVARVRRQVYVRKTLVKPGVAAA